jgi:hypothetical protein
MYTKKGKEHSRYKHGMAGSQLYNLWCGIKRRCINKNEKSYPRYGGVGVTISKEWLLFENVYRDMGKAYFKGASIDRIDNSKGYSKKNCRWVDVKKQSRNRRHVKLYAHQGKTLTIGEWEKELGFKKDTLYRRIKKGWSFKKTINTPLIRDLSKFK